MDRLLSLESLCSVVRNALPDVTVESINPLPRYRLLRSFGVDVSDGRTLLLSLPPPPTLGLLRSEQSIIISEFLVTKWILETSLEPFLRDEDPAHGAIVTRQQIDSQSGVWGKNTNLGVIRDSGDDVLRYLPILISHFPSKTELGHPFNIFEPTRGVPISGLTTPLTRAEKGITDFQQGRLARQLSKLTSPNGLFGPASAVLSRQPTSIGPHGTQPASRGHRGTRTWRKAFHSLLEGVLRDAEDMAVTISYEPIRAHFNRIGHVLDGVTTSRLVILDANDETNVLVSRSTKSIEGNEAKSQQALGLEPKRSEKNAATGEHQESEQYSEGSSNTQQPTIAVTGLRDWSNCIFGDPLIAEVFSRDLTPEFLRGFSQRQDDHLPASASGSSTAPPSGGENPVYDNQGGEGNDIPYDIIEDHDNAPARLLLYECYHATACVVKQFYRPGRDSSGREITARRRLTAILAKLEEFDETASDKRPRRPSGAPTWPVKKARGGSDADSPNAGGEEAP
ncbi:hypothetical protein AAE478_010569 [Parahypoxylon ruwenzoriense]